MSRPTPWSRLCGHELRLLTRSRAAAIVAALLVLVVGLAAWNGVRWTAEQRRTVARVQAHDATVDVHIYESLAALARRGDPRPPLALAGMPWYLYQPEGAVAPAPHIDPRRAEAAASEWVGARHAVLPPGPAAAFAIGQSDVQPFYTRVTIRTRPALVHSDEIENPMNLSSGRFDLAFALTFCWPVLVLPLVYNVWSEERETGTLALVASQPVSLRTVMLVRLGVRLGLPVALTLLASFGVLGMLGSAGTLSGPTVAAWTAAVIATAVFWGGIALAVNVTRWRSATGAAVLIAVWLALVVVAPAILGELAQQIAPVPSRVELITAVRQAGALSSAEVTALVSTYYDDHSDAAPTEHSADEVAIRGLAQQDEVDRRVGPVMAAHRAAVGRQQALVDRLRYLSPPLLVYDGVAEFAGTTATRYRRFADQVDGFHREWRAYHYPLVHAGTTMTRVLYERAPRFAFQDEPVAVVLGRVAALVMVVMGSGLVTLLVALRLTSAARVV